ncbi:hypothetical protein [Pectinatus frisingensis]|uniref:hypothetical protein n=1 Tax=Pectinatus frisingensis TaxID=865 RepID=UPI0018C47A6C|nr:hypothetical protein [Pectinatus frisingensis]
MIKENIYKAVTLYSFLGLAAIIFIGVTYVCWVGFIDHGEVNMSAVSWLLAEGKPVYTDLNADERYSLEHGPVIYLVTAGVMRLMGPSLLTAKVPGYVALVLSIIISAICFYRLVGIKKAIYLIGLETWILLKWPFIFMNRDDSFMLLCMVIGLLSVMARDSKNFIGIGISLGILVNLKIHGFIYFLPILVLAYKYDGWKRVVCGLLLAFAIAIIPFLLPEISLVNYLQWLLKAAAHGISIKIFVGNLIYTLLLVFLIVAMGFLYGVNWNSFCQEHRALIITSAISTLIINIIGAKLGSGSYHLIPLVPILLYFVALIIKVNLVNTSQKKMYAGAVLALIVLLVVSGNAINSQQRLLEKINKYSYAANVIEEIRAVESNYNGHTIEIGYGEDKTYSFYRQFIPLLVFDGNPYLVDGAALMDMQLAGLPMPQTTISDLTNGKTKIWLIPKGNEPFSLHSYYDSSHALFEKSFGDTFKEHYSLVEQLIYFDVWVYQG